MTSTRNSAEGHFKFIPRLFYDFNNWCVACGQPWPCDANRLGAELERLLKVEAAAREVDRVRSQQFKDDALPKWYRDGLGQDRQTRWQRRFGEALDALRAAPATDGAERQPSGPCIECGYYPGIEPENSYAHEERVARHIDHRMATDGAET